MINIFKWAFFRLLGLRDAPKIISWFIEKSKLGHYGTIVVDDDAIVNKWNEVSSDNNEHCPYKYSTKIIRGVEISPGVHKKMEYWVVIRRTFLAPIIPIPFCNKEIIYNVGESPEIVHECKKKYGNYYSLINHKKEYGALKIEKANIEFCSINKTYRNISLWKSNK